MPSRWRSRLKYDDPKAGERSLAGHFLTFDLVTRGMLERPLPVGRLPVVNLRVTVDLIH